MIDMIDCPGCDTTQAATEFTLDKNRKNGLRKFCKTCDNTADRPKNLRRHFCTIQMPDGHIEDWVLHQKTDLLRHVEQNKGRIIFDWVQDRPGDEWPTRKELLTGKYPKSIDEPTIPNRQISSPKPRKVPSSRKNIVTREEWNDSAISSVLRYNLQLKYNVCEFTGAPAEFCHESHILSRKLCREWGHPEWVEDEENVIFILSSLNQAMNPDVGYWLEPSGLFAPPPGKEFAEWMLKLGIPDIRINMTKKRIRFAQMSALEKVIET